MLIGVFFSPRFQERIALGTEVPPLLPWQSVGGCGEARSPTSGVPPSPVWPDEISPKRRLGVQSLMRVNLGQDFFSYEFTPRLTGFVHPRVLCGISLPIISSIGIVQPFTNVAPRYEVNSGLGDIRLDGRVQIIDSDPLLFHMALQLPTGVYDRSRGTIGRELFLPSIMQPGLGMYVLTATFSHIRNLSPKDQVHASVEWVHPFQMRLADGKNEFLDDRFEMYSAETSNKRFYYRFKHYGENDLGRYIPPELRINVRYSHDASEIFRHTWATTVAFPFGVQWIPDAIPYTYAPHPDPDHRMWRSTWYYIPELRFRSIGVIGFVAIPLNDKANDQTYGDRYDSKPYSKFDGPDWESLLHTYSLGVGIRYRFLKLGD